MIVKLLTEHLLEFLGLKGGCRGSSESTLVKMPHCLKSHATAQLSLFHQHQCLHPYHGHALRKNGNTWRIESVACKAMLFIHVTENRMRWLKCLNSNEEQFEYMNACYCLR